MRENGLTNEQNERIIEAVNEAKRRLAELNKRKDAEREGVAQPLGYAPVVLDNGQPSLERSPLASK